MYLVTLALLLTKLSLVENHGMMLTPPNRSSLWRFDTSAPINYDDNANFCGGYSIQWDISGGKCGVCGDPYPDAHPQKNENGGKYGRGVVVDEYNSGDVINITVQLTANHRGYFQYSVCPLEDYEAPETGEECFIPLQFSDGRDKYQVQITDKLVTNEVVLPEIECPRCVLRWHYNTGNNWGDCGNGTSALGCGPQETFRSCADVSIYNLIT